jgi:GH25 family lysozyme M1 (1,4-beta-N-acetylmuramidase)
VDLTWGVDLSHWQGVVDWSAVGRSGLADFAAVRLTVGLKPDERWQANLAGAADHTPLPMAYAVVGTRAAQADAADLLVNMVDRVADVSRVGLVVDAENFSDGSHPTMTQVHAFRDALHRLTGRWACGYCPSWWMTQHGYVTDEQPWPWWPSRYCDPPFTEAALAARWPPLRHGFHVAGPWQFTSDGQVPGIASRVDRNAYDGTLADLRALTLGDEDMALSEAEWDRLEKLIDQRVALILRGDPTHPDSLKTIRADLDALEAKVGQPIDLEQLAALVVAKQEILGHPAYEFTGTATPKEATP